MEFINRIPKAAKLGISEFFRNKEDCPVRAFDIRNLMQKAKSGQIILRKYNRVLDTLFVPGQYTHSGTVDSRNSVIHAIDRGVERIDIIDFVKDCDGFVVLEPIIKNFSFDAQLNYVSSMIGMKYDFGLDINDRSETAFFCHELTAKGLLAGGLKLPCHRYVAGNIERDLWLSNEFMECNHLLKVYENHVPDKQPSSNKIEVINVFINVFKTMFCEMIGFK